LNGLPDVNSIWANIGRNYNKQVCFRDYTFNEILGDRDKAKRWFNNQKDNYWGRNAHKVINPWIKNNENLVREFIQKFKIEYTQLSRKLNLAKLEEK
jgi:hypothetical protein